jgi:hypothetical protein
MAVDGNWNLTMSTPMGERKATLTLLSSGGTLTGTQGADGNSTEIFDGAISGDAVNWKVSITNPMPLTLEFIGKVSGDSMSGEMGIGPMGSFPFTGTRRKPDSEEALARFLVHSSMHKITFLSIAVLAASVGAAIAQAPAPDPAWRESALAMVPSGYVAGQAYRTDEAGRPAISPSIPPTQTIRNLPPACSRRDRRWSSGSPKAMAACAPCRPN